MRPTKYRKKPVVVEAMGPLSPANVATIGEWCRADLWDANAQFLVIKTLEGDMRAVEGDYIVRGVKGEFYPCKPDIFEATYEPA
jgi:hypothetical protein